MALANSVYFFKLRLPEVEPCDCVQGGVVLHVSEEKSWNYGWYFENFRSDSAMRFSPFLSFFFSSFLFKEAQIPKIE